MVTKDPDLSPVGTDRVELGKTTKVDQLALGTDLRKCSAVVLAYGDEFAAAIVCPAPARGSASVIAAQIGVGKEVVQVDLHKKVNFTPAPRVFSGPALHYCT